MKRASQKELGNLSQTFMAATRIWDAEKADGVPTATRLERLEQTLRAAWPRKRDEPWHFLCVACRDLGLEMFECDGSTACGRRTAHLPHSYGRPCLCAKGAKYAEKPKPQAQDFKQAGFSKVGRR